MDCVFREFRRSFESQNKTDRLPILRRVVKPRARVGDRDSETSNKDFAQEAAIVNMGNLMYARCSKKTNRYLERKSRQEGNGGFSI